MRLLTFELLGRFSAGHAVHINPEYVESVREAISEDRRIATITMTSGEMHTVIDEQGHNRYVARLIQDSQA